MYDSAVMRRFAWVDLGRKQVSGGTTVGRFRGLPGANGPGARMLRLDNALLGSEWEEKFRWPHILKS